MFRITLTWVSLNLGYSIYGSWKDYICIPACCHCRCRNLLRRLYQNWIHFYAKTGILYRVLYVVVVVVLTVRLGVQSDRTVSIAPQGRQTTQNMKKKIIRLYIYTTESDGCELVVQVWNKRVTFKWGAKRLESSDRYVGTVIPRSERAESRR